MCVQRLEDSMNSAIRINYGMSLRSSSMPEPEIHGKLWAIPHLLVQSIGDFVLRDLSRPPGQLRELGQLCQDFGGSIRYRN